MTSESAQDQIDVQIDNVVDDLFEASGGDVACIADAVAVALRWAGVPDGVVAVLVTDDAQMRAFNRDYRGVDAPTDVLSFAQHDGSTADGMDLPPELALALEQQLGDLVIALPYTQRQAQRYGTSLASELRLLAVHGTLHLLGYDHATPEEKSAMWAAQNAILVELGEDPHIDREYD